MRLPITILAALLLFAASACNDDDDDGGNGDDNAAKCDALIEVVVECYDGYCQGAGSSAPFCQCWNAGQDIDVSSCECIPLNLEPVCKALDLDNIDPNQYDCSAATTIVSDFCN